MQKAECVYVIGAGFSAGLGYPLTSDLLVRLWDRIDGKLKQDMKRVIEFHHLGFNADRFASFPNVEQLLSEMLVNEELFDASRQYEGRFTKNRLKALQRDFLLKIADWFHELAVEAKPSEPTIDWIKKFRDRVGKESAAIISFNWDLILDELLFGSNIGGENYGFSSGGYHGAVLLKPHGSLNWFEGNLGTHLKDTKRVLIFGEEADGDAIYAFREFRAPRSTVDRVYTPLIVPPVYLKNFSKPVFRSLWNNCTATLSTAKKVVFLGYSMPDADFHAKFIMRCGFHNQQDGQLVAAKKRKPATGPAEVIIVNPDYGAAKRIASIVGPEHNCKWISKTVAEWISAA